MLSGDAGLEVVDVVEDVATAQLEGVKMAADVLLDLIGAGHAEYVLRVDRAAPEGQLADVSPSGTRPGRWGLYPAADDRGP